MSYMQKISLGYKDVFLVPNKCVVRHRTECDTTYAMHVGEYDVSSPDDTARKIKSTVPGYKRFRLPIIPANMPPVVDLKTYDKYAKLSLMPIMHRFDVDLVSFLSNVDPNWRAISTGVEDLSQIQAISEQLKPDRWPHLICIDIAHGHSDSVKETIRFIRKCFGEEPVAIMAGNVTTPEAVMDLQDWGANYIKVGIGPGQVCSTKNKTGFHVPMFTAIEECAKVAKVPIVADGGIRENGDIAKALVAGADLVMIGGMFAACADSPAIIVNGKKEYYGSASIYNHNIENIEGFVTHLTPTMTIESKVREIIQDLQSAISYAGGKDLSALDISKVRYNIVFS